VEVIRVRELVNGKAERARPASGGSGSEARHRGFEVVNLADDLIAVPELR
jgi:hypothetical protein